MKEHNYSHLSSSKLPINENNTVSSPQSLQYFCLTYNMQGKRDITCLCHYVNLFMQ